MKTEKLQKNSMNFFTRNCKYFAITFFALFMLKSIQSCNRNTQNELLVEKYDSIISLKDSTHALLIDSIKSLQFSLIIANQQVKSSKETTDAVQSTVANIKANTTITVKNDK